MAIHPNPDRNIRLMNQDHGTVCLITDIMSDKFLNLSKKKLKKPYQVNFSEYYEDL
jgi:hypothetical protein